MTPVTGIAAPAGTTEANGATGGGASSADAQAAQAFQTTLAGMMMTLIQQQMSDCQDSMNAY
jgi:hypothetical protein